MAKSTKTCDSCGAKIVEYKHKLNQGLVAGLRRLADAGGHAHLNELGLTYAQQCNFQKLRYWALVVMVVDKAGQLKSGHWRLTPRGQAFLDGNREAAAVFTYRGDTIGFSVDTVTIADVDPTYRKRPDYIRDARPHQDPQGELL